MIIGFSGKIGSGKTTLCDALCEDNPVWGFSYSIRQLMLNFFVPSYWYWTLSDFDSQAVKSTQLPGGKTVREVMQFLGVAMRSQDPECLIRAWIREIDPMPTVFVPDVRFPNEVEAIESMGGIVIRLTRTTPRKKTQKTEGTK